ncbi:MAG: hypothetical protein AAB403_03625 [Planctomycetota bacterium]
MTTPYTLDHGTLFAHEIRDYRRDSDNSTTARRLRKEVAHARKYPIATMLYSVMAVAALLPIAHAYA